MISCDQDDDSFQNTDLVSDDSYGMLYQRGGEEPEDSLVVLLSQNMKDGDPPPKNKDQNGGKPFPNKSVKNGDRDEKYSKAVKGQPQKKRKSK